jgi:hypothetical protein
MNEKLKWRWRLLVLRLLMVIAVDASKRPLPGVLGEECERVRADILSETNKS